MLYMLQNIQVRVWCVWYVKERRNSKQEAALRSG